MWWSAQSDSYIATIPDSYIDTCLKVTSRGTCVYQNERILTTSTRPFVTAFLWTVVAQFLRHFVWVATGLQEGLTSPQPREFATIMRGELST